MSGANISGAVRTREDSIVCPKCGSDAQVRRGLCLNCLLALGLEPNRETGSCLKSLLDEIDISDADWRIGNYQILEEIGRGGMGVIYRARQRHSRRIVALKRVLSFHADSQETLVRFRREAEAAASLDHPNILPIYEVGEDQDGIPFFSMKFAADGSLVGAAGALRGNPREIVRLMAKITRAVQYAHRQGILHRDLKPGNILLDGRGEPLVSDFGLAKWLDASSNLTRTLTIFGTPGYIAPEQAKGPAAHLTPAADIYSLGAILFDLFAGRPPFLGEHALAVIHQASEKSAPKLRSVAPMTDRDLETICAKCLERDPQARYRSADNLATDLERWLEGRPIFARPVRAPARLWRWAKRNPILATTLGAFFSLAMVATVWEIERSELANMVRRDQLAARSVIVLPFLNLDTAAPDESVALNIGQSLQTDLVRLAPARIVPVTQNVSQWAGTGDLEDIANANHDAKARAVLTGTVRFIGNKRRVSIRLINASTGDILLAKVFESSSNPDQLELGKPLSDSINAILDITNWSKIGPLARDAGMKHRAAREFILSGRQLMGRYTLADYDRAIRCFRKAIQLQPRSPLTHAYLSSAEVAHSHFVPDPRLLEDGEREAREAVRLDPDSPDAHRSLAGACAERGDLVNGLEEQLRAIELGGPEERVATFMGNTLITLGRPHQALGWLGMATRWASMPGRDDALVGDCWSLLGDDERAEAAYARMADLRPELPDGRLGLCHLRLIQGKIEAARQLYAEMADRMKDYSGASDNYPADMAAQIEFFGRSYAEAERLYTHLAETRPAQGKASYGEITYASALARLCQTRGDDVGASTILIKALNEELASRGSSANPASLYRIAAIYACLGDRKAALDHLDAAAKAGWIDYRSLRLDPRFDSIAKHPVFKALLLRLEKKVEDLRRQTGQQIQMALTGESKSPSIDKNYE